MHSTISGFLNVRATIASGALSPAALASHFQDINGRSEQRHVGTELDKVWSVLSNPATPSSLRQEYHDVLLGRFPVYAQGSDGKAVLDHVRQPYAPYAFLERHLVHYRDRVLGDANPAWVGVNDKDALLEMRAQVAAGLEMLNPEKYPGPVAARNAAYAVKLEEIRTKPRNTAATPHPDILAQFTPKP